MFKRKKDKAKKSKKEKKPILKPMLKSFAKILFKSTRSFAWILVDGWLTLGVSMYVVPNAMRSIASAGGIKYGMDWEIKVMYWLVPSIFFLIFLAIMLGYACYKLRKLVFVVFDRIEEQIREAIKKQRMEIEKDGKIGKDNK